MTGAVTIFTKAVASRSERAGAAQATGEPFLVRWLLIVIAMAFLALFLVVPLVAVFS